MKPEIVLTFEFVELIPDELKERTLYISPIYSTALHKCCCGCGREVVTPLSPTGWQLTFDGTVSLYPSIGSWSLPCQSHYFIRNNKVVWAPQWSKKQIEKGRLRESNAKEQYYAETKLATVTAKAHNASQPGNTKPKASDSPHRKGKPKKPA